MGLKAAVKRKLPATFNAVEYETGRLLDRIQELEAKLYSSEQKNQETWERLVGYMEASQKREDTYREAVSSMLRDLLGNQAGIIERVERAEAAIQIKTDSNQTQTIGQIRRIETAIQDIANALQRRIDEGNLFSIIKCKSDEDFDRGLIPFNRFFQGHGMALSMHLTSADKKLDESVYRTADLTRTSALALIADEIYARKLGGAVAELGVAQGKFAEVINALFPDRKLYLFDTFDGFPEADVEYERLNQYSNPAKHWYAGINLEQLMERMRFPDNCVIKQGYFPDTAAGLEESFCFVNIDCDLYKSTYAGLNYFYPRLVNGGYLFVHDYRSKYFRGVREALCSFADEYGISYCVLPDNTGTAVIVKQRTEDEK